MKFHSFVVFLIAASGRATLRGGNFDEDGVEECQEQCPETELPVCGVDGVIYDSKCQASCHKAETVVKIGQCTATANPSVLPPRHESTNCDDEDSPTHMVLPGVNVSSEMLMVKSAVGSQLRCPSPTAEMRNRRLGHARQIQVRVNWVNVKGTPNDPGSYEEWRHQFEVKALTGQYQRKSYHYNVREKTNRWYRVPVNLETALYGNTGWQRSYVVKAWGKEDDTFWDDHLPLCQRQHFEGTTGCHSMSCSGHGRSYAVYYCITEKLINPGEYFTDALLQGDGDSKPENADETEPCDEMVTLAVDNDDRFDVVSVQLGGVEMLESGQTIAPGDSFSFLTNAPGEVVVGVGKWDSASSQKIYWSRSYPKTDCSGDYGVEVANTKLSDVLTLYQTKNQFCGKYEKEGKEEFGMACFTFGTGDSYKLHDDGLFLETGKVQLISWPDNSDMATFKLEANATDGKSSHEDEVPISYPWNCFSMVNGPGNSPIEYCRH